MRLGSANVVEVFSSVQGEGLHVGASTLFVRFGECDLRCRWCDSVSTWRPAESFRFELERGTGRFRTGPNPVALDDVVAAARELDVEAHRFVSFTGGEPLLQPEAVWELAGALGGPRVRVHLETHGLATAALERVVERVDVVAMDWKLASDVRRATGSVGSGGSGGFGEEHEAFLKVALRAPECFVKVVVTPSTLDEELDELVECLARVAPGRAPPLVLQPVTPCGPVKDAPGAERLLGWQARFEQRLQDVRVVPQTHKLIGVL